MARPSKQPTPEVRERIVQALRMGSTYRLAAAYAGVSYNTWSNWIRRGEAASSGLYRELVDAVRAAEGEAHLRWLATIERAAQERDVTVTSTTTKEELGPVGPGGVRALVVVDRSTRTEVRREYDWKAAAWKLERRYPREYGRTVQEAAEGDIDRQIADLIDQVAGMATGSQSTAARPAPPEDGGDGEPVGGGAQGL